VLWFLLWFILLAAAAAVLAVLGLRLYRQAKAFSAELSAASYRLTQAAGALSDAPPPGPAAADRL
jgi:hypothetical protein